MFRGSVNQRGIFFFTLFFFSVSSRAEDIPSLGEEDVLEGGVSEESSSAGFSGDVTVRAREIRPVGNSYSSRDSRFRHNVYFYQRTRLRWNKSAEVGWMGVRPSGGPPLNAGDVGRYGVFKYSAEIRDMPGFQRIVMGNYALSHGQGLLFYDGLGEFVRPVKIRDSGASSDYSSGRNSHLKGAALSMGGRCFSAEVFLSKQSLDAIIDPETGRVNQDLNGLREGLAELRDADDLSHVRTLTETMAGGRVRWGTKDDHLGATAYDSRFSRIVDPVKKSHSFSRAFRGNRSRAASMDFQTVQGRWNFFGEAALSISDGGGFGRRGKAWTVTPLWREGKISTWAGFFNYDAGFFTRHGKGISFAVVGAPEDLTNNQNGVVLGFRRGGSPVSGEIQWVYAEFPESRGSGSGTSPIFPSKARQWFAREQWNVSPSMILGMDYRRTDDEVFVGSGVGPRRVKRSIQRVRPQILWEASEILRLRFRYDLRREADPSNAGRVSGRFFLGEFRLRPRSGFLVMGRAYFFNSRHAYSGAGTEEVWRNVMFYRLAGGLGSFRGDPGTRFSLIVEKNFGKTLYLWGKYDVNNRPRNTQASTLTASTSRRGYHFQVDYFWGKRS